MKNLLSAVAYRICYDFRILSLLIRFYESFRPVVTAVSGTVIRMSPPHELAQAREPSVSLR